MYLILICLFLCGCKEEAPQSAPSKPQGLPKDLHSFQVLPEEPEPVVEIVEEEEETPELEMEEEHIFPDPRPLMRENRARTLRALRQVRRPQGETRKVQHRLLDPDYQQWPESSFEENKSTYPVDRSHILTADMRISAILEDEISSQVPGRFTAIVDRDVLSPGGKKILIPAYSKILCTYEGLERVGDKRLAAHCTRILRPDGVSVPLKSASAGDQSGRTGLIGAVDNRTWERYGAAFLVSGISALSASAIPAANPIVAQGANAFAQNLSQVTAKVLEQNIDLTPVITIPQGSRIQIRPQNDIVFRRPVKVEKVQK